MILGVHSIKSTNLMYKYYYFDIINNNNIKILICSNNSNSNITINSGIKVLIKGKSLNSLFILSILHIENTLFIFFPL